MCVTLVWTQRWIRGSLFPSRDNHPTTHIMRYGHQVQFPYNTTCNLAYNKLVHTSSDLLTNTPYHTRNISSTAT